MTVTVHCGDKIIKTEADVGAKLSNAVFNAVGVLPDMPCGGAGTCGKCRVALKPYRVDGSVPCGALIENGKLSDYGCTDSDAAVVLMCRYTVTCDMDVWLSAESEIEATTESSTVDFDFSPILREGYGLAVDIGTTTVALYLCNFANGKIEALESFENPQRGYGSDVITRLDAVNDDEAMAEKMQYLIIEAINNGIAKACEKANIKAEQIHSAVFAGNTVMEHFFAGYDARGISKAPFTVSSLFGFSVKANELGVDIWSEGEVYLAPCFSAYVGGDISSGLVSSGVSESEGFELFLDIGTNGEMGIGGKNGVTLCSTAAGPALEGAKIECGMPGVPGAVNRVFLDSDGNVAYETIGGLPAKGICGSGIIDAVAVLLDLELIDEGGYLEEPYYIDKERGIYISPADVREIQLAKAAICAGILTLLEKADKTTDDITRVVLAGGFGSNLNRKNACRIGLIPAELEDKITVAGNTSGAGAVVFLLSETARSRTADITAKAEYIELSGDDVFADHYIEQMMFEE